MNSPDMPLKDTFLFAVSPKLVFTDTLGFMAAALSGPFGDSVTLVAGFLCSC